jgi:hypothetical protein
VGVVRAVGSSCYCNFHWSGCCYGVVHIDALVVED